MKRFLPLFLLFALQTLAFAEAPKYETRAVWLTTIGGLDWPRTKATGEASRAKQQQELRNMLDELHAAGINTVLFQTRIRGTVVYPSRYEKWDACLAGDVGKSPGYDPLAFAIDEAHARGMELHAWVVCIPVSAPFQKQRPNLCYKQNGSWYMRPELSATADYISDLCAEIVDNYDVDGIHFDYIRYPEGTRSGSATQNQQRRDNITRIVRKAYDTVKRRKPWVKMTSSPVGKYADTRRYSSKGWNARDAVYQDAQLWLREGIQDGLFPMMYFTGNHFYPFALDWQENDCGRPVCPGLGIYFLSPKEKDWPLATVTRELHFVRDIGLGGAAYFRARFLLDNEKGILSYLKNYLYAEPALVPPMTWQSAEAPEAPRLVGVEGTPMAVLSWTAAGDDLRYNIYASAEEGPVDVTRAENLMAAYVRDTHFRFNRTLGLSLAVTAVDRYGNESEPLQWAEATPVLPSPFDAKYRSLLPRPLWFLK